MSQPWRAEERVSPELAMALLEEQFPGLAPVRLELLGEGWDNVAYLVNGAFVFRFPRRQIAVGLLEQERRILPVVAGRVHVEVPRHAYEGVPGEKYRWPFLGYRMLPGRTLSAADPTEAQRAALAEPLGRFLRELHATPVDDARAAGAAAHVIDKLAFERILPEAEQRIEVLRGKGRIADVEPLRRMLKRPAPRREGGETLCHGDLYSLHLLVDDHVRLSGVIDWGDLHLGDVAVDLAVAHLVLPMAAQTRFRETYGEISEDRWECARLRALFHAATTAVYGEQIGNAPLLKASLWALGEMARADGAGSRG